MQADPNALPADVQHAMNGELCEFAMRWKMDGDYLRCRECDRPQLAGYHHLEFPHATGCKTAANAEPHPWQVLVRVLRPIAVQWQPIDTAPRDGTEIWCYLPQFDEQTCLQWTANEDWAGWQYLDETLNDMIDVELEPSHWMPRPANPPQIPADE